MLTVCQDLVLFQVHHDVAGDYMLFKLAAEASQWFDALNLFMLKFYSPANPMGSCGARSVYLTTGLLGKLSPLSS